MTVEFTVGVYQAPRSGEDESRLEEAALVRVLGGADARETDPGAASGPSIWAWDHPLARLAQPDEDGAR